jgi:CMP-N-acetylneuraminic acid synthetase
MYLDKILAVIPARGGSKAIKNKNIIDLCGQPLIEYSINEALKVDRFTDVVVSTDDLQIAELARNFGALVPFMRPKELAEDLSPSALVIKHALQFMEKEKKSEYDAVIMLQPTAPLRMALHIEETIDMLEENNCDSVVSIVSVEGYHPFRMKRMIDNRLINFIDQGYWDMRPRQVLPPVYIRNGAIYLNKTEVIIDQEQLIGSHCLGYLMSPEDSVNIDSYLDLTLAEALLKERTS